ncbi:hypothetical protein [Candidatus Manganitrophus noduliformans]|uniref:Uncharacterized protein n=1 Tax=Candidatus Manganitrophus noduliformans TaxID=2606439 RepID=A0A7X6I9W1_9BACT|nr:hypothetical protein [Candidatus Manganitrophus noduliformans]NKE69908.1 hypothetical protein [Candidatus Manganitrophus noduliformans]
MAHDDIRKGNGLRINFGDRVLFEDPPSKPNIAESIYRDEGSRIEPGNPNRSAVTPVSNAITGPIYGPKNIAEERVSPRPGMTSPPLPEWPNTAASAVSPPTWERRGIPTIPAVDSDVSTPDVVASPGQPQGLKTPEGMGPPAPESATAKWFKNMTPDQRTALQRSLLATGLSLMASQRPSRYPVSTVSQVGEAGLTGLAVYDRTMAQAGEAADRRTQLGLRERQVATEEARLRLAVDEAMRKAEFESPGTPGTVGYSERPTSLQLNTGGVQERPVATRGEGAGPRALGLNLGAPEASSGATRPERGLVVTPGKEPGQGYRAREADIRYRNAVTDKLLSETGGEIFKLTLEEKRLGIEKAKAEIGKLRAEAAKMPKSQRDYLEEKAQDGFTKAYLAYKKEHPEDEDGAIAAGFSVYNSLFRMGMGDQFIPGEETGFWPFKGREPGQWVSPPAGAKDTGRTSGGKKVYQLPDGNYWVP